MTLRAARRAISDDSVASCWIERRTWPTSLTPVATRTCINAYIISTTRFPLLQLINVLCVCLVLLLLLVLTDLGESVCRALAESSEFFLDAG